MMDNMDNIKYNVSEIFELPKDIVMDLAKITVIGNIQVYVSNHKGIIEYSLDTIRINTNNGVIKITGENLHIKTIMAEEIIVLGYIEKIELLS